jgi:hypothetical protein
VTTLGQRTVNLSHTRANHSICGFYNRRSRSLSISHIRFWHSLGETIDGAADVAPDARRRRRHSFPRRSRHAQRRTEKQPGSQEAQKKKRSRSLPRPRAKRRQDGNPRSALENRNSVEASSGAYLTMLRPAEVLRDHPVKFIQSRDPRFVHHADRCLRSFVISSIASIRTG